LDIEAPPATLSPAPPTTHLLLNLATPKTFLNAICERDKKKKKKFAEILTIEWLLAAVLLVYI
jgi:hypothetical protein